jgi:hypothetical protein
MIAIYQSAPTAQRDAEHEGWGGWKGSFVEPWLFRACIKRGGRPGDCSDDASHTNDCRLSNANPLAERQDSG